MKNYENTICTCFVNVNVALNLHSNPGHSFMIISFITRSIFFTKQIFFLIPTLYISVRSLLMDSNVMGLLGQGNYFFIYQKQRPI